MCTMSSWLYFYECCAAEPVGRRIWTASVSDSLSGVLWCGGNGQLSAAGAWRHPNTVGVHVSPARCVWVNPQLGHFTSRLSYFKISKCKIQKHVVSDPMYLSSGKVYKKQKKSLKIVLKYQVKSVVPPKMFFFLLSHPPPNFQI